MQQKISAKNMNLWWGGERDRDRDRDRDRETEKDNIKGILHELTHADTGTHNM